MLFFIKLDVLANRKHSRNIFLFLFTPQEKSKASKRKKEKNKLLLSVIPYCAYDIFEKQDFVTSISLQVFIKSLDFWKCICSNWLVVPCLIENYRVFSPSYIYRNSVIRIINCISLTSIYLPMVFILTF